MLEVKDRLPSIREDPNNKAAGNQKVLEVNFKVIFDLDAAKEGIPHAMPSFTMLVSASDDLREAWQFQGAIEQMEGIFRDQVVLGARDELFVELMERRESSALSPIDSPGMPVTPFLGAHSPTSTAALHNASASPPSSTRPSSTDSEELWGAFPLELTAEEEEALGQIEAAEASSLCAAAATTSTAGGRSAEIAIAPSDVSSHPITPVITHIPTAKGSNRRKAKTPTFSALTSTSSVHAFCGPALSAPVSSLPASSAPTVLTPVSSVSPSSAPPAASRRTKGKKTVANGGATPLTSSRLTTRPVAAQPPHRPAPVSGTMFLAPAPVISLANSQPVDAVTHPIRIARSRADQGTQTAPRVSAPPPYAILSDCVSPPSSLTTRSQLNNIVFPPNISPVPVQASIVHNRLVALDFLSLSAQERSVIIRCLEGGPGAGRDQWEGLLHGGGLSEQQIALLLPLMDSDVFHSTPQMTRTTSILKIRRIRAKPSAEQIKARRKRLQDLTNDIITTREGQDVQIQALAKKHRRTLGWAKTQVLMGPAKPRRAVNCWNAFLRRKMDIVNKDRAPGNKQKLHEYIAAHMATLREEWNALPVDEIRKLEEELRKARVEKDQRTLIRAAPKAIQSNVIATFKEMNLEWERICAQTGIEGFYFAVRHDIEHYHEPRVFTTEAGARFLTEVIGMTPRELALKLEAWVVSGLDKGTSSHGRPRPKVISECRTLIQGSFDTILQEHKLTKRQVKMNYENYEGKIVERFGVALKGWPVGMVCNPSKLNIWADLDKLAHALNTGACKWVLLTEDELVARKDRNHAREKRGEVVYKPRKRATAKGARSAARVDTDSSADE